MAWDDVDCEEVAVHPEVEFDRVGVDSIIVTKLWRALFVVVLVDITIDWLPMEETVEEGVGEVVCDKEEWDGQNGVENGHFVQVPKDTVARSPPAVIKEVVVKDGGTDLVGPDVEEINHWTVKD